MRINFTASMPIGIYSLSPLPAAGVERGMVVVACAPGAAAALGRSRVYLGAGPCPGGTEPLLKSAAAIAGDEVDITAAGVVVNGCRLPQSAPLARDRSGRRLDPWPRGHYRLGPGQVWLYADNAPSWDSRYWGPGQVLGVLAEAEPLLTTVILYRYCVYPSKKIGSQLTVKRGKCYCHQDPHGIANRTPNGHLATVTKAHPSVAGCCR